MKLHDLLFPELASGRWGVINLNEIAEDLVPLVMPLMDQPKNPFLDPEYCEGWKNFVHKIKGLDYSEGGYLEDRSTVWDGHYHEDGSVWHLGVDFYVPADIPVHLPCAAKLVHVFVDPDQRGGWGGKLIFQREDGLYFILGHLHMVTRKIGEDFPKGAVVGMIGPSFCNGGWSPHLHVQCMTKLEPDVDGYGALYDGIEKDFPDPLTVNW